jgi:DNA-binding transcriptional LysR family regulator
MTGFDTLTLDQLSVFLAVVDHGGFAAAARKLGRAPSAITYAIERLEESTGTVLFDRSTYRASLTDAGRALLPGARRVLDDVRDLRTGLGTRSGRLEQDVSVVLDAGFVWPRWMETVTAFRQEMPSVDLRVRAEPPGSVADVIADGHADFGVLTPAESRGAGLRELASLALPAVTVVSTAHPLARATAPLTSETLKEHVQIVVCDRQGHVRGLSRGAVGGRTFKLADVTMKRSMLRAGVGWGHLPLHFAARDLDRGRFVRLTLAGGDPAQPDHSPMVIAHRPQHDLGPAARWLAKRLAAA